MVPRLLFTLLQVGEVALHAFGPTKRGLSRTFNAGLDERLNQTYHNSCEEEEDLIKSHEDMPGSSENWKTSCLIYPTNHIACAWTLTDFPNDIKCHASICVSDRWDLDCGAAACQPGPGMVAAGVGHVSADCQVDSIEYVTLTVNVSHADTWWLYTCKYDWKAIRLLSPPSNVTAWVTGTELLVHWDHPPFMHKSSSCLNYELDINGQVRSLGGDEYMIHKEIVDPTQSYNVKVRVKNNKDCLGYKNWSNWSNTTTVAPPNHHVTFWGVAHIVLGIPLVLLVLLLLIRHQRDRLFPPIPGPTLKIKHFLEIDNRFQYVPQTQLSKCVEEITVVEEAEEIPDKITNLKT